MLIPQYWAQARLRHETGVRHGATVQRWGWSDTSQQAAQAHADERARQALDDVLTAPQKHHLDADFERMERLGEYGLEGNRPIREEVLERRGATVMTRNSYGAHCLNTPDVAIADIDLPEAPEAVSLPWLAIALLIAALATPLYLYQVYDKSGFVINITALVVAALAWMRITQWLRYRRFKRDTSPQAPHAQSLQRLQSFLKTHPDWGMRVYETPKGLRVIATHATFSPDAPEVQQWFGALQVDPIYEMLCARQQCFRARVSAKPWRINLSGLSTMERRWPVPASAQQSRQHWTEHYERKASQFAACRLLQQIGNPVLNPQAQAFVQWHDASCRAQSALPLA